jgi:hypothetical protein
VRIYVSTDVARSVPTCERFLKWIAPIPVMLLSGVEKHLSQFEPR